MSSVVVSSVVSSEGVTDQMVRHNQAMQRLVTVVQELSLARDLQRIMTIVRTAAREITGADGATFVLRDNGRCFYADEDAISPLWKGMRFPMTQCISGWVMLNCQPTVIPDIYQDPRIPADAYRPTFVKSLVMVPIRAADPIGAIGNYWATPHRATDMEVSLLQSLANTTAVAMENVSLLGELESRVQLRTAQLEAVNAELEAFSYSVAHDLRAPLQNISLNTEVMMMEGHQQLERCVELIGNEVTRMGGLIEDLLRLARYSSAPLDIQTVDLSSMAEEIVDSLHKYAPQRQADVHIQPDMKVKGDAGLLRIAMENLLSNAWKYTGKRPVARIDFSMHPGGSGTLDFSLQDNGVGFDMQKADRLFAPFQRLHAAKDFKGTGVGLATVQRIIRKHGGTIRAQAAVDQGATFSFTLPQQA